MRILSLVILSVCFAAASSAYAEELMKQKDFLKKELAGNKISKEVLTPDAKLLEKLKEIAPKSTDTSYTFYYGKGDDGALKKACTVVPQKGKEGPMSVGVCFSAASTVDDVVILEYMEERGKPVKEEAFISQFRGKSITSPFRVANDINGVTGATNSSWAVSEAVRKTSLVFKEMVLKEDDTKKDVKKDDTKK